MSADPLAVHVPGEADLNLYAYVSGQTLKSVDPRGLSPDEIKNRTAEERAVAEGVGKALWNWTVEKVADAVGSFSGSSDPVEAKNPRLRAEHKAGGEALTKTFDKVKFSRPTEPVQAGGFSAGKAIGTAADVAGIAGAAVGAVSLVRKGVGALRKAPTLSKRLDDVLTESLEGLAGPGGVCFVAGTPVVTAEGLVPIEEVQVGDLVLSKKDDGNSENRWRRVKQTFEKRPSPVLDVEFRARDGQSESLGVTPNHPFWKRNTGWVEAGDLRPEDSVWSLNRGWLTIRSVRLRSEVHRVYNLEVEDDHTYSVGRLWVWVHNQNCAGDAGNVLSDSTVVCRGGACTADRFVHGSGVTLDAQGKLQGVSVNAAESLDVATKGIPHGKVGATTVGEIRAAGGNVVPSPNRSNPSHATMSGVSPEQAERLFTPGVPNPSKK